MGEKPQLVERDELDMGRQQKAEAKEEPECVPLRPRWQKGRGQGRWGVWLIIWACILGGGLAQREQALEGGFEEDERWRNHSCRQCSQGDAQSQPQRRAQGKAKSLEPGTQSPEQDRTYPRRNRQEAEQVQRLEGGHPKGGRDEEQGAYRRNSSLDGRAEGCRNRGSQQPRGRQWHGYGRRQGRLRRCKSRIGRAAPPDGVLHHLHSGDGAETAADGRPDDCIDGSDPRTGGEWDPFHSAAATKDHQVTAKGEAITQIENATPRRWPDGKDQDSRRWIWWTPSRRGSGAECNRGSCDQTAAGSLAWRHPGTHLEDFRGQWGGLQVLCAASAPYRERVENHAQVRSQELGNGFIGPADHKWVAIWKGSARQNQGCYSIPIPWKEKEQESAEFPGEKEAEEGKAPGKEWHMPPRGHLGLAVLSASDGMLDSCAKFQGCSKPGNTLFHLDGRPEFFHLTGASSFFLPELSEGFADLGHRCFDGIFSPQESRCFDTDARDMPDLGWQSETLIAHEQNSKASNSDSDPREWIVAVPKLVSWKWVFFQCMTVAWAMMTVRLIQLVCTVTSNGCRKHRMIKQPTQQECRDLVCLLLGSGCWPVACLECIPYGTRETWGIVFLVSFVKIVAVGKATVGCLYAGRRREEARFAVKGLAGLQTVKRSRRQRPIRAGRRLKGLFLLCNLGLSHAVTFGQSILHAHNNEQEVDRLRTHSTNHSAVVEDSQESTPVSWPCGRECSNGTIRRFAEGHDSVLSSLPVFKQCPLAFGASKCDALNPRFDICNEGDWSLAPGRQTCRDSFEPHFVSSQARSAASMSSGDQPNLRYDSVGDPVSMMQVAAPTISVDMLAYFLQTELPSYFDIPTWLHTWDRRYEWAAVHKVVRARTDQAIREQVLNAWRDHQVRRTATIVKVRQLETLRGRLQPTLLVVPVATEDWIITLCQAHTPTQDWMGTFMFNVGSFPAAYEIFRLAIPFNQCVWSCECWVEIGRVQYSIYDRIPIFEGVFMQLFERQAQDQSGTSTCEGSDDEEATDEDTLDTGSSATSEQGDMLNESTGPDLTWMMQTSMIPIDSLLDNIRSHYGTVFNDRQTASESDVVKSYTLAVTGIDRIDMLSVHTWFVSAGHPMRFLLDAVSPRWKPLSH